MPNLNHPTLYTAAEMTDAVNKLPLMPLRLAPLFEEKGVRTTTVSFDVQQGKLVLVENQSRIDNPKHLKGRGGKPKTKVLECAHLPLSDTILPEDIQDVRGFGTTEQVTVESVYNDRMLTLKNSIEMTTEFHRMGAVKGVVHDADGVTVLHDLYSVFGITKKALTIAFPDTVPVKTNPVLKTLLDGKRHIEQKAGGLPISRFEALVGSAFYDALTGHTLVREAFENWQANQTGWGDNDYRRRGFTYAGITFIEASEVVNGRAIVEENKAHLYPLAPGMFKLYHAPANWLSAVNTVGLPFYAQMDSRDLDRGLEIEVQSNPLALCMYPECLVEFTAA
jgi:hypothetical protein